MGRKYQLFLDVLLHLPNKIFLMSLLRHRYTAQQSPDADYPLAGLHLSPHLS